MQAVHDVGKGQGDSVTEDDLIAISKRFRLLEDAIDARKDAALEKLAEDCRDDLMTMQEAVRGA